MRQVRKDELVIYVENAGDFEVPFSAVKDADAEKLYARLVGAGGLTPHAAMDIKGVETVLKIRETYGEPQKKMGPVSRYVDTSFYEKAMAKK